MIHEQIKRVRQDSAMDFVLFSEVKAKHSDIRRANDEWAINHWTLELKSERGTPATELTFAEAAHRWTKLAHSIDECKDYWDSKDMGAVLDTKGKRKQRKPPPQWIRAKRKELLERPRT